MRQDGDGETLGSVVANQKEEHMIGNRRATKTRIVGLLVATSLAAIPAALPAAAPATTRTAPTAVALVSSSGPIARAACARARILGKRRCIARGQFCTHTRRANRDYHRYGFHCGKRDRNGRYHLVYR